MYFQLDNLRNGYVDVVRHVLAYGEGVSPRGLETSEVLGAILHIKNPQDTLPLGVGRKASPKLAAIEALQLVGGYSDVEQAKRVSPALEAFEDLGRFHGAYGPRVLPQLFAAVRRLVQDPESRRAVINVWDPVQDLLVDGVKNYPCATQLQFLLRMDEHNRYRLVLYVTMRSNDAWKGLAYDAFTFAQLQYTVANALGVEVGEYVHHAVSMHLYKTEWEKAEELTYGDAEPKPATGFGYKWMSQAALLNSDWPTIEERLQEAVGRARDIGAGRAPEDGTTESEEWYLGTLAGLL